MNTISFSKSDFPEAGECVVGQEEALTVRIVPTAIDGDGVTADVVGVEYSEPVEEEPAPAPVKRKSPVASIGIPMKKQYA